VNEAGPLVTQDVGKNEVLNAALPPVFTSKAAIQDSQSPETREKSGAGKMHLVEENQVRECFSK